MVLYIQKCKSLSPPESLTKSLFVTMMKIIFQAALETLNSIM